MARYFVSRQSYYYSQESVVEVATNGVDSAGPDMLVKRYKGEQWTYEDPKEAVEAAIAICKAWRADGECKAQVCINPGGLYGMEGEPTTFEAAREWAEKVYDSLPKCDQCGKLLPDEEYWTDEFGDFKFCREFCQQQWEAESHAAAEEA